VFKLWTVVHHICY